MRNIGATHGLVIDGLGLHGSLLHISGSLLGQVVGVVYFVFSLNAGLALHWEDIVLEDAPEGVLFRWKFVILFNNCYLVAESRL
jgi:hypothetical protein